MRLLIFHWNKKVNSPRHLLKFFCRSRISVTHFASPGCLWTPLVAVHQKANPAYPGFYNGGGSRRGAWPGSLGDVSLPVGFRGRAPIGVLDEVPQKLKNNVKLVYNF